MGKVKKPLPTPDKNPVDGDKLIEETKPKKVKCCDDKFKKIQTDIDKLGDWLTKLDDKISNFKTIISKLSRRMGL